MKFSIHTLGCRVNQSESDVIEGNLVEHGHSVVPLSGDPDYCVVNTCSVTAKSDHQSRQLIRRALRTRAQIIVTGCYAQLRPGDIGRISRDIQIVENSNKYKVINLIDNKISEYCFSYSNRSRPSIKIQDGCNNACTFCIVPHARGRSRSIEMQRIVDQIATLESRGYNEVVLTGIHLGSYGKDHKPKVELSALLETIINKTTISRIRLSSIGINEIDSRLLELLQEGRICNHLHIPLQSGDNAILRRMNRSYDSLLVRQKVTELIMKIPNIAIGTDVIVGFPGETQEAFLNTRKLIEEMPFAYLHIFPYSARAGSKASRMVDQVESSEKKSRYNMLKLLSDRKKTTYMISQIDRILGIIIEDEDTTGGVVGTSSNYLKIRVPSNRYAKKSLIPVRVAEREGEVLSGIALESL
jgi:threonylcarbamoyladenosine tRNA methylthiotransferase MtaB